MTIAEIRKTFFEFFASKDHEIVPSAPMVVKDDPTLMFVNAGMNQFKDLFLGNAVPKYPRIANSQKCLRVSGKHNDLEEVGVDTYHHTMFEMLGNWSFGNYFKDEAIGWAWELLTEVYKLPVDRLYVTVFEGDAKDGVPRDEESVTLWKRHIDPSRIILASKKDNFWEMGDVGPCGPCTEIHVDLRTDAERKEIDGKELVNHDHPQVIEIWNNVFMEFNRKADGSLEPLPAKHVDTGMGLERLAMALQGKRSNYDTDLFQRLIRHMEGVSGVKYGTSETTDIALRVIADHIRAIAFSIADGQLPSNTGAGYVIRRILRRAVRYGYQTLKLDSSFLADLSAVLVEEMGDPYIELINQKELISKVIREEENSFFRTLELGLKRIDHIISTIKADQGKAIPGAVVFELYDTFGFPADLTSLIARENNISVDEAGFEAELQKQKDRSRAATTLETDDWVVLRDDKEEEFVGYDYTETTVFIVKYRKVIQKQKTFFQVVFNITPFYPEGGGQVGDSGFIEANGERSVIFETKKENNLIVHLMANLPSNLSIKYNAVVDLEKRTSTTRNHSTTHLLHHALREVLGTHVEQKGSLVSPDYLRFDFSHFEKVSDEQLEEIQNRVSEMIRQNIVKEEHRNTPISKAKEMGAMALFGEKYGDTVRVIQFGDSIELCGGTHVESTGNIGVFVLTSESAVAAGIRRIEAITGKAAEEYYRSKSNLLDEVKDLLKSPKDVLKAVQDLLHKTQAMQKEIEGFQREQAKAVKNELKSKIEERNTVLLLSETVDLDAGSIKDILFQLRDENKRFIGILGGKSDEKCSLSMIISDDLLNEKSLNASNLIREASPLIQGGGGGQAFFATAGGKNPAGLEAALKLIAEKIGI
jgi:alanyl-tRNA synthetase